MPATFDLQRLDRRYDGHDRFTHRVQFMARNRDYHSVRLAWVQCRIWLWNGFGPSAEVSVARPEFFDGDQPNWAWDSEKFVVYLNESTLTAFLLKKESWENA
jgi:hypothetical protein